ncbi:hypothetical protein BGZ63DRAFT_428045 [Mariannaea sp. PMI_226]|nr:hypothetical protein BGZ63DRAFT_428045 [Mariannaea sp. PMI_226]
MLDSLYSPELPLTWDIEGIADDGSNGLLLVPQSGNKRTYPPYHLICVIDNDPSSQALWKLSTSCGQSGQRQEYQNVLDSITARLDAWSSSKKQRPLLRCITIGSRIHIPHMPTENENDAIWIAPNIALKERYLTIDRLMQLWSPLSLNFPPSLDFEELQTVKRLHDTVSIVLLPSGEKAIFKGVVAVASRMYHELRELLRIPCHPNVMAKPTFLATRTAGSSQDPICGFILDYHPGGTLLDKILRSSEQNPITLKDKMKWIWQIIIALEHIHRAGSFYPELRPENIVFSKNGDIVLVDFEQFGSPSRWTHPLVGKAVDLENNLGWENSPINPVCMPNSIFYSNPPAGYLESFSNASELLRQTFENYSLAKVMWCIFEEQTNMTTRLDGGDTQLGSNNASFLFPQFSKTPDRIRYWIWLCTRSSPEWGGMACKCHLKQPDVCELVRAGLQTSGLAHLSIKDSQDYFETAMKDELHGEEMEFL